MSCPNCNEPNTIKGQHNCLSAGLRQAGTNPDTGTPKADLNPKAGLAHDFNCTHDPCICTGTQELRKALDEIVGERDDYIKGVWLGTAGIANVPKTSEKLEALINTRIAAVLENLRTKQSKHFTSWGGKQGNCVPEDVLQEAIQALRKEVS